MRIAIASGKGGTGKTTVATNLAAVAARAGRDVAYLDCDVEEPNGALFLRPAVTETRPVRVSVPAVDADRCTACGLCGQICQYSAILLMGEQVLVFPSMCHGCGGCWRVCPAGAITETFRQTGEIQLGRAGGVQCVQGLLHIGEAMSPPVIHQVKASAPPAELIVIDAPPGTSCPAIEAVRGADFALLVTEPTPFGLHDLALAVEMVRALRLPLGVLINRAGIGDSRTQDYCRAQRLDVLAEIPDDRALAEAYSRGQLACEALPELAGRFERLLSTIEGRVRGASRPAGAPR